MCEPFLTQLLGRMQMMSQNAIKLGYTHHAHVRAAQRGFSAKQVATILRYGRKRYQAGAIYYSVGRKEIDQYAKESPQLKQMNGIHVVTSIEGAILTMFRNRDFSILNRH